MRRYLIQEWLSKNQVLRKRSLEEWSLEERLSKNSREEGFPDYSGRICPALMRKVRGDLGMQSMLLGIVMIVMGYFLSLYILENCEIRYLACALQDGMKISCLAAAVPDTERMLENSTKQITYDEDSGLFSFWGSSGNSSEVLLKADESYERFQLLWQKNLKDMAEAIMTSGDENRIQNLQIEEFIIFNVQNESTTEVCYDGEGKAESLEIASGEDCQTPDGSLITQTSIYARMSFSYRDMLGRWHDHLKTEELCAIRIKE